MESNKYNKYEKAVEHVKKIKGFYRHVLIYFVINIVLIVSKKIPVLYVLVDKQKDDQAFIDWVNINIWSTPIIWGIVLLIHGLYVYRYKFSFFRGWEERKIKELMEEDNSVESSKWK